MENYILNRKIVEIEKNKEYAFRIPTMFNAESCEFVLEVPEEQIRENLTVELAIQNPSKSTQNNLKLVRVDLTKSVTTFKLKDMPEIEARDYLLLWCKANNSLQMALSIRK